MAEGKETLLLALDGNAGFLIKNPKFSHLMNANSRFGRINFNKLLSASPKTFVRSLLIPKVTLLNAYV